MKIRFIVFVFTLTVQFIFAQSSNIPIRKTQLGFGKIDFMSINMPETTIINEPNMGFSGIHYNLLFNDKFYTGIGIYGSLTGKRGGFFTLGINAGMKNYIFKDFYIDTGFHFGGGGGAAAPDGGGAFILPHTNFGYDFKNFSINSGWSYVNFFDGGRIKNHQLNIGIEVPLHYKYTNYELAEREFNFSHLQSSSWNTKPSKLSLLLHLNNLNARGRSQNTLGDQYDTATIQLAGFELALYLTKNWFGFIKVDGAYHGIPGGYMDVFLGAGYFLSFNKNRTNFLVKFAGGAGGGGGIDTKGGFLIYPDISLEQKIFKDTFIAINTGFVMSPNSDFYSNSYGLGIKYYVEKDGVLSDNINYIKGKLKGLEIIMKQDIYFDASRNADFTRNMQQISLQINLDLTKNLFVAGQTSFANFGDAGAYAEGIVGLGLKTNLLYNKINLFSQVLTGAAGGGGISTGQGLILKPSLGINYKLSNTLNFRTAGGYVKARGGKLSSGFINFGINYTISFMKLK